MNWELADVGLGPAEEVAVEEGRAEDSSPLEGEISFFMKGRKKIPSCLFRLRPLIYHCFQIHLVKF